MTNIETYLDPDGDGTIDLSGGYHDAGDHVKFGLPGTFAGSTSRMGIYMSSEMHLKLQVQLNMQRKY